ncbi:Hypothetical protein HVR_LOCUS672 [uncultured virus]|nr:Hypothetical protein HVR_LOCUS672 [uncultured virus]
MYLKRFGIPIILIQSKRDVQNIAPIHRNQKQTHNRIILTRISRALMDIPSSVSIHILHPDSTYGLDLVLGPNYHDMIHIYINTNRELTPDLSQYTSLAGAISDISSVYQNLIANGRTITDEYNNLFIS